MDSEERRGNMTREKRKLTNSEWIAVLGIMTAIVGLEWFVWVVL